MEHLVIPANYRSELNLYETQEAIKTIKDFFQQALSEQLTLLRVTAPLFVTPESGLNDNLNGVERPVAFDIKEQDGQTAEIVHSLAKWKRYALKKYGIEGQEREKLYSFIGPPLNDSFEKYYGFSDEKAMEAIGVYREYFRDKGIFENEVYDGIRELLQKIKASGRKIVLATSKPEEFALTILEHFELIKYFDVVAGASMDEKRNKKGDVIRYALEKGCLTAENAVMVGDREHDVFGAKENGIDTIGVLYGYGSREERLDSTEHGDGEGRRHKSRD